MTGATSETDWTSQEGFLCGHAAQSLCGVVASAWTRSATWTALPGPGRSSQARMACRDKRTIWSRGL